VCVCVCARARVCVCSAGAFASRAFWLQLQIFINSEEFLVDGETPSEKIIIEFVILEK